jgi:glutathione synthase/RimK-type ligase-like ATP-grasp enzyme
VKFVILTNEIKGSELKWKIACEKINAEHIVVDISKADWLELIENYQPNILLTRPAGLTSPFKILYDERLEILVNELDYFCFPTLKEVLIYENKKYFSYWLKANKIPHPKTAVFYFKQEALEWVISENSKLPIVAKTNIGASGSGVVILETSEELQSYIKSTFSGKGATKRIGPNLKKGRILQRGIHLLSKPKALFKKIDVYKARALDVQKDFVLFQEYIPHTFEWRVVRMGDSFFAHKKLLLGKMTSGSLLKDYGTPPLELLDFVKAITDKHQLYSQAVDVFESPDGYLVNEMQCIFGQSDAFQMKVNDCIGRYLFENGTWKFEAGDFNTNESFDLRLQVAIKYFQKNQSLI